MPSKIPGVPTAEEFTPTSSEVKAFIQCAMTKGDTTNLGGPRTVDTKFIDEAIVQLNQLKQILQLASDVTDADPKKAVDSIKRLLSQYVGNIPNIKSLISSEIARSVISPGVGSVNKMVSWPCAPYFSRILTMIADYVTKMIGYFSDEMFGQAKIDEAISKKLHELLFTSVKKGSLKNILESIDELIKMLQTVRSAIGVDIRQSAIDKLVDNIYDKAKSKRGIPPTKKPQIAVYPHENPTTDEQRKALETLARVRDAQEKK